MLGAYKARVAPFNVNYRYVAEELDYLLADSAARGIVYHSAFAPTLAEVRDELPDLDVLQVADGSGHALLPGAEWYEDALAAASAHPPAMAPSPTISTCSTPAAPPACPRACCGDTPTSTGRRWAVASSAPSTGRPRPRGHRRERPQRWRQADAGAPVHARGAAHWLAFNTLGGGNTLVLPHHTEHLDPADVWSTIQAEGVDILLIVGDAFGRPLVDELERGDYDLSSMLMVVSGGEAPRPGVEEPHPRAAAQRRGDGRPGRVRDRPAGHPGQRRGRPPRRGRSRPAPACAS